MTDQQFLIVIRKPRTLRGWAISVGVPAAIAGAVLAWCQHTTNALSALATDVAVIRAQVAPLDRRMERVEDVLIGPIRIADAE